MLQNHEIDSGLLLAEGIAGQLFQGLIRRAKESLQAKNDAATREIRQRIGANGDPGQMNQIDEFSAAAKKKGAPSGRAFSQIKVRDA